MTDEEYEAWVEQGVYNSNHPSHENAGDTDRFIRRRMDMDMGMTFNPSKALIALVGLICMTVLIAVGAIDQDQGLPIITMIVGYCSWKRHGRTKQQTSRANHPQERTPNNGCQKENTRSCWRDPVPGTAHH
jgi:hypothetical protein